MADHRDHDTEIAQILETMGRALAKAAPLGSFVDLAQIHHLSEVVSEFGQSLYDAGRRHAVCDLVRAHVGTLEEGAVYAIDVRRALPGEEQEATRLLRQAIEGHLDPRPRNRDQLN